MGVEQQDGLAAGRFAKGILSMARAVEVGEGNDAVIAVRVRVGHDDVGFRQRFFEQIRVEGIDAFAVHAGQEDIMRIVQQIQPHNDRAAAAQAVDDAAVLTHAHAAAGQIAAGNIQLARAAEAAQEIAEKHHRRARRAAFSGRPLRSVAVEAVEHDVADEIRRDLLAVKQIDDRVHHGDGAAVVFGHLIMQRRFHPVSLP